MNAIPDSAQRIARREADRCHRDSDTAPSRSKLREGRRTKRFRKVNEGRNAACRCGWQAVSNGAEGGKPRDETIPNIQPSNRMQATLEPSRRVRGVARQFDPKPGEGGSHRRNLMTMIERTPIAKAAGRNRDRQSDERQCAEPYELTPWKAPTASACTHRANRPGRRSGHQEGRAPKKHLPTYLPIQQSWAHCFFRLQRPSGVASAQIVFLRHRDWNLSGR